MTEPSRPTRRAPGWRRRLLPLAAAAFAASATVAFACSCVDWQSPQAQLDHAELAVIARAVWTRREAGGEPYDGVTLFNVERTLKGGERRQWRIAHLALNGGPACGVVFTPGERIVLFANTQDGRLATSACQRARFPIPAYERAVDRRR